MDAPRAAVRLGVFASVAVLVGIVVVSVSDESHRDALVMDREGHAALAVPTEVGVYPGSWSGMPITVFVAPKARLDGVEALRGEGHATASVAVPGHPDLRLFALSAKSTHLGCTVGFNVGLGASMDIADYDGDGMPDGRMLDPCHQGQWDIYHRGVEVPGTPTHGRMAVLDVRVEGGQLRASQFDGPIGPPSKG
jgi:Rieske Fe-S protein